MKKYNGVIWVIERRELGIDWFPVPFQSFWTRRRARDAMKAIKRSYVLNKNIKHRITRYYRGVN